MVKPIAIHLPQFHPFPENDNWWGKGFTEWTNVTKAKPKFKGHYQPQLPSDLGFYDLRLEESMIAQAELAKKYGIYGFCYYHYWFNGKLLMERPLETMLSSKKINIPFCLCWANENWTRRWDGNDTHILIKQDYNLQDDRNHIKYLIQFFKDDRYIKINDKPLLLIYRVDLHPGIIDAVNIWREEAKKSGFPDLFLVCVENFQKDIDPKNFNFDAGMEFAPDFTLAKEKYLKKFKTKYLFEKLLHKTGVKSSGYFTNKVFSYENLVNDSIIKQKSSYKRFRSVCPAWDNSPRRQTDATIYHGSTPEKFGEWVRFVTQFTKENFEDEESIFFINAWNEWAEGNHLEPDLVFGTAYLESFKRNYEENK